jgi:hypothetical protein
MTSTGQRCTACAPQPSLDSGNSNAFTKVPTRASVERSKNTHQVAEADRVPPTVTAVLERGPLAGRRIDVEVIEGRPPKTIDVPHDEVDSYRYCLADWVQSGPSAIYTFLYRV